MWQRNSPKFMEEQKKKMILMSLSPFLFGVSLNLPKVWIDILHQYGILEDNR